MTNAPVATRPTFHELIEKAEADPDSLTVDESAYILYVVQRARDDLATFCFAIDKTYRFPAHIKALIKELEQIEHTPDERLMVTVPPRHGKSLTCSINFPAWYLGRNPDKRIITASYSGGLTYGFAVSIREIMDGFVYQLIFPSVKIKGQAKGAWGIQGYKGGLYSTSVNSAITGMGCNLLLIDDPIKDAMFADSASWRDHLYEWFTRTAYTRLQPGAPVFLIACMTGDTPVLMADGTERPLRDVKVGDRVATYDNGKLGTSTVQNHTSNGVDRIFRITMMSGKTVWANARHPFLVDDYGKLKWVRLKNLTIEDRIVELDYEGVYDFASEQIKSIEPAGVEEVFDVQIEGTENFIANGLVSHNTRWHWDDLSGRILKASESEDGEKWREVYFPAIDANGKALWPEQYDEAALARIKGTIGPRGWNSLYQGKPTPDEGGAFKLWYFRKLVRAQPSEGMKYVRYWDKAGTEGGGDWTVGVLLGIDSDGRFFLCDLIRGQWSAYERNQVMKQTAEMDNFRYKKVVTYVEQEPGSGGLESAQRTLKELAGFRAKIDLPQGSIDLRAEIVETQMEAGNFYIVLADWNQKLIDEAMQFPLGAHDDQIAAIAGAMKVLTGKKTFKYELL